MNPGRSIVRFFCQPARHGSAVRALAAHVALPPPDDHASYSLLCDRLDAAPLEQLSRTICLLDLMAVPQTWDLLHDTHPCHPTWLVWRYPEVYWVFLVDHMDDLRNEMPPLTATMHFASYGPDGHLQVQALLARHQGGMRAWFDPWELRRSALCQAPPDSPESYAFGTYLGVVLDDEAGYAVFNSYLLYRRNIPVALAATAAEFGNLAPHLKVQETRKLVVLEDVELNYADGQGSGPLMPRTADDLLPMVDRRAGAFGFDAKPPAVHFYVSATMVPRARVSERHHVETVLKPVAGLDEPGILRKVLPLEVPDWIRTPLVASHCAHADAQQVASALLVRARVLEKGSSDTLVALHGALLAFEAERLLANQTYAMTMESMAMRHWFEAMAECVFAGATDELTVTPRLRELEIKMILLVYHMRIELLPRTLLTLFIRGPANDPNTRLKLMKRHKCRVQVANGMLEVLSKLRDVYVQHRKAEEEERVLQAIRWWRVKLYRLKRPYSTRLANWKAPAALDRPWQAILLISQILEGAVRGVVALPLFYMALMLRPKRLCIAILAWIGLAAAGFHAIANAVPLLVTAVCTCTQSDWLLHAAVTFIAMQTGIFGDPQLPCMDHIVYTISGHAMFWYLTLAEMAVGYFHLALVVAVLVQRITRR